MGCDCLSCCWWAQSILTAQPALSPCFIWLSPTILQGTRQSSSPLVWSVFHFFPFVFLYDSPNPPKAQSNKKKQKIDKWSYVTWKICIAKGTISRGKGNLESENIFRLACSWTPAHIAWHWNHLQGHNSLPIVDTKTHKCPHIVGTQMASNATVWPDYISLLALVLFHIFSG